MDILNAIKKLRDDLKVWVTNNLNALNRKIDEKTIPIDNELDSSSTNPVQNKVVANAINNIEYDNLKNAPDIFDDDSGNMVIADESGNIIFRVDNAGAHTTSMTLEGKQAATEEYVDAKMPDVPGAIAAHNNNANAHEPIRTRIDTLEEKVGDKSIEERITELGEEIVSEKDALTIADKAGNKIFEVNKEGAHTTNLILDGDLNVSGEAKIDNKNIATQEYADSVVSGYATELWVSQQNYATLENGKIPSAQLPSYVDDVVEGVYDSENKTFANKNGVIEPESDKIYLDTNTNKTYRWSGTTYVSISSDLALGETEGSAYRGDRGKIAYDHTLINTSNPGNPHGVNKTHLGLENVDNTSDADKPISKATQEEIDKIKEELAKEPESDSNELVIVDSDGNIITRIDKHGVETTNVVVDGVSVKNKDEILDTSAETIVGAINELNDGLGDISTALDSIITQTESIIGGNS